MRSFLVLVVVAVLVFPQDSHSTVRFADIGFEVSGLVGDISPADFNQIVALSDADPMAVVYGVGAAALLPLGERFRVSVGSGYYRAKSGQGTFELFDGQSPVGFPTPTDYLVESVPLTGTVDAVLTDGSPALTLGAALEMHFLSVTRTIDEQPALDFPGSEQDAKATIPGLSLTAGVEWAVGQKVSLGFAGGYRFSKGDVPFFQFPDLAFRFDLSGPFATVLVRVHPWQRAGKD